MRIDERLAKNAITPDPEPHIVADQSICAKCETRPCIQCCPGHLYELVEETGEMTIELSGCVECGTCLVVCPHESLTWRYPCGGSGVRYRFG
jgi:ferredoxin like protein